MSDGETRSKELTFLDGLKEFGWFGGAFATFVSGPSLLTILEDVFSLKDLAGAFQWVVDGYQRSCSALNSVVAIAFEPFARWLEAALGFSIVLGPHWVHVFAICAIIPLQRLRTARRLRSIAVSLGSLAYVMLASIGIGLLPISGGPPVQAIIACIPVLVIPTRPLMHIGMMVRHGGFSWYFVREFFVSIFMLAVAPAALGFGLAFIPGLGVGAGLIAAALLTACIGLLAIFQSDETRFGLSLLGGFVVGGVVVAGEQLLQLLKQ